jgi:hypothetical protein
VKLALSIWLVKEILIDPIGEVVLLGLKQLQHLSKDEDSIFLRKDVCAELKVIN